MLGHDGPPSAAMWRDSLIDGEPLKICPQRELIDADPDLLAEFGVAELELYPLFRRGFLYSTGGVEDQPARYMAYMREIDDARTLAQLRYDEIIKAREEPTSEKRHRS